MKLIPNMGPTGALGKDETGNWRPGQRFSYGTGAQLHGEKVGRLGWEHDDTPDALPTVEEQNNLKEEVLRYVVTGGAKSNGITVRRGVKIDSPEIGRLAWKSMVVERTREGNRMFYTKISGEGPMSGWVSLSFKGSPLLEATNRRPTGYAHSGLDSRLAAKMLDGVKMLREAKKLHGEEAVKEYLASDESAGIVPGGKNPSMFMKSDLLAAPFSILNGNLSDENGRTLEGHLDYDQILKEITPMYEAHAAFNAPREDLLMLEGPAEDGTEPDVSAREKVKRFMQQPVGVALGISQPDLRGADPRKHDEATAAAAIAA